MDDASPPKWHLAHVTWFFETFLLKSHVPDYQIYHPGYEVLFNSYYNGVGELYPRQKRGLLSRPTVAEVMAYRQHVDREMLRFMDHELSEDIVFKIRLGLQHEQQHQELLVTDIKYNLGNNPLHPVLISSRGRESGSDLKPHTDLDFVSFEGGIREIGAEAGRSFPFAFDNESPRHQVLVRDFEIADRLVTNGDYLQFMADDGYVRSELWLSDAWALLGDTKINCPLYWRWIDNAWFEYTLTGLLPLRLDEPVCHVSGYEADAFARWKNARLPTEQEWEVMAENVPVEGNFLETENYHPRPSQNDRQINQVFGDAWEWTSSSYGPYPGFQKFAGTLGEYNGKFMVNQLVLRGGSCASPQDQIRPSYRNFFYPKDRWQFSGIRIARDC